MTLTHHEPSPQPEQPANPQPNAESRQVAERRGWKKWIIGGIAGAAAVATTATLLLSHNQGSNNDKQSAEKGTPLPRGIVASNPVPNIIPGTGPDKASPDIQRDPQKVALTFINSMFQLTPDEGFAYTSPAFRQHDSLINWETQATEMSPYFEYDKTSDLKPIGESTVNFANPVDPSEVGLPTKSYSYEITGSDNKQYEFDISTVEHNNVWEVSCFNSTEIATK